MLSTPALILDVDALEHNIDTMATLARRAGKQLRPHAKTHKCVRIARQQLSKGALGISVATVHEATVMLRAGIRDVLVTSPVVGKNRIAEVVALAEMSDQLLVVVDSMDGLTELETAFARSKRSIGALLDIDVGMRRTGTPSVRDAVVLAERLAMSGVLRFRGLQCYSGEVQHIRSASRRAGVYGRQLIRLEAVIDKLTKRGLRVDVVSGGGTGTASLDMGASIFTELQVGSYVFMDNQYGEVELFHEQPNPFKASLLVQGMVISNNHAGLASIDAGTKSFSIDGPVPKAVRGAPRGTRYQFHGDEFGLLRFPRRSSLELGSKVEFTTPHCDPTVNLHDYYHCVRGNRVVDIWPVDARGPL